ncbi:hypothetical protein [Micromonospora sp. NPDC005203]|uniref:hypothetical protein n=1 Tax=Micromonospora sp. NPDC005203 TaxID=3364226 RepID=UPI003674F41E
MNVYPFIESDKDGKHNVTRARELIKVSRSAYYQYATGQQSQRDLDDKVLTARILEVHARSKAPTEPRWCTPSWPTPGCGTAVNASPG